MRNGNIEVLRPSISSGNLDDYQQAVNDLVPDGEGMTGFERRAAREWPNAATDPRQAYEKLVGYAEALKTAERFKQAQDEFGKAAEAAELIGDVQQAEEFRSQAKLLGRFIR